MKKTKALKFKQIPICKKCDHAMFCHFCGRQQDSRGWAKKWRNVKNGPLHTMCPSCAE